MNVLTSYFNRQLRNAGFPDDFKIEWSLGYCQGDGMAFYGDIPYGYFSGLFKRIYPEQKRQQRKFERLLDSILNWENQWLECSICRNHFGNRYSHFNTMEVHAPRATELCFFYEEAAKREWYFPKDEVHKYLALWDDFIADLGEYIRDLSKRLARDGYRIIEATPHQENVAYKFETANYRIEFITAPYEFYSHYFEADMLDCDFEDVESLCNAALKNGAHFADVYAQVRDRATDTVLGEDRFGYLTYNPEDKTFGGYRQILIREAIKAARSNTGLIGRQAQLMRKHLPILQNFAQI